ncbi:MAG: lipid-A-disaccharide synthase [Opitutaceae bacterium]
MVESLSMPTAEALPFPPPHGAVDVLVIAGEHSGDEQAARMVSGLLARHPRLRVAAIGGPMLRAVGAQLLFDLTASSVVGLVEVLSHYGFFKRIFAETVSWIREHQPRVVCFVDYPGFNLRMAAALREAGLSHKGEGRVRIVYYISPQIWAWKPRRRFAMEKNLDALAAIFPFETDWYKDTKLPVSFVGHPFVSGGYLSPVAYSASGPVLLLPGSRVAAVRRIAPVLFDGFEAFLRLRPEKRAVMIYPSVRIRQLLEEELARRPALVDVVRLQSKDTAAAASAVLTSSGTISLVCALAAIPGAIAYRANPLTYVMGRFLMQVPYIGIANLLLPEPMYPEFIQGRAAPAVLAAELEDCLINPARIERARRLAGDLRNVLARPPEGDAAHWLAAQIELAAQTA